MVYPYANRLVMDHHCHHSIKLQYVYPKYIWNMTEYIETLNIANLPKQKKKREEK